MAMAEKAKFIGACRRNPLDRHAWQHTDLCYEYRGHTYIVTKNNNGYTGTSMREQHRKEQERIDELIAHENDPMPETVASGWNWGILKGFFDELEER